MQGERQTIRQREQRRPGEAETSDVSEETKPASRLYTWQRKNVVNVLLFSVPNNQMRSTLHMAALSTV
jgi:hypothetical protein